MSRRAVALLPLISILISPFDAGAQESEDGTNIDLYGPPPPTEACTDEQEAAIISGEIIVCRRIVDQAQYRYSDDDEAETRYAQEKERMGEFGMPGALPADFVGPGIFKGKPTVSGLCIIGPCPPQPALIIDLEEIPEAPPGSDADRVGRGLAPIGNESGEPEGRDETSEPASPGS